VSNNGEVASQAQAKVNGMKNPKRLVLRWLQETGRDGVDVTWHHVGSGAL